MVEERAVRLAVGSMFSYQQVVEMLRQHPNMTDEEAKVCLEAAQTGYAEAMIGTLYRAVGIFVRLEGEISEQRSRMLGVV